MNIVDMTIQELERRCSHLEMILARRDMYAEMIDWSAMTLQEREWDRWEYSFEIYTELWELENRLETLVERESWIPL
ncbi:hypothetical protein NYF14_12135 [Sphingobium sp. 10 DY56-G10]|uniref:hypothetical protein n=1 Tax=Sphingomonadales TaxID=204457 RepID=UPI0000D7A931|nr:hypothetical protein [Sphingomonas sp. SKA58]EAT10558.1 hypothetical protein SKA58_02225 [Sphingomonas sp. SKA58]|tara:strand:+ start:702 stop:932 length:231 start_codon:yes stop_codon:yes gene_type:complete